MRLAAASLLLADARTPSGGHSHSGGLEAAIQDGLGVDGVPGFVRARLRTVGLVDAALSAAAVEARGDLARLLHLEAEAEARCQTPRLRAAARSLGRGLLRTGAAVFPGDQPLADYSAAGVWTPRPVAFGVLAGAAGLTPEDAAYVSLYEDAAAVASAAVKLLPVDALAATAWVAGLGEEMHSLATEAATAAELPSVAAPLIELRSLHREERSLFAS